jgi:hypothetical protein
LRFEEKVEKACDWVVKEIAKQDESNTLRQQSRDDEYFDFDIFYIEDE